MTGKGNPKITVRFDPDDFKALKAACAEQGIEVAKVLRAYGLWHIRKPGVVKPPRWPDRADAKPPESPDSP